MCVYVHAEFGFTVFSKSLYITPVWRLHYTNKYIVQLQKYWHLIAIVYVDCAFNVFYNFFNIIPRNIGDVRVRKPQFITMHVIVFLTHMGKKFKWLVKSLFIFTSQTFIHSYTHHIQISYFHSCLKIPYDLCTIFIKHSLKFAMFHY